jgi:monoamine oxidase
VGMKGQGVEVATPVGSLSARAAILTVSTAVLGAGAIKLPPALDSWRHAAASLPLGRDEKLFLEIVGESSFEPETRVIGDPRNRRTGVYHIRPFGWNVIEGFVGGEAARMVEADGPAAGFAHAVDQLAALFGSSVRGAFRPLVSSNWGRTTSVGGAYSHALPGRASARRQLAEPFEERLFFAGEATHLYDFSTAHGAYESGVRAAEEVIAALAPNDASRALSVRA